MRYALGYRNLGEGDSDIRTLYNFRQRLACYHQEHGVNLLDEVFQTIADEQLAAFGVRTGVQRLDSTQIGSNIRDVSRLQLAVEAVQRLHRLLDEAERATYAEWLAPFVERQAGQYAYRVKGQEATRTHLQKVGVALYRLLTEMAPKYQAQVAYRQKAKRVYKGYVASASETCDPENGLQLITQVQVAPNNVQDTDLLRAGLPSLKARTGVETVITDAGYCGPKVDAVLRAQQVVQVVNRRHPLNSAHISSNIALSC